MTTEHSPTPLTAGVSGDINDADGTIICQIYDNPDTGLQEIDEETSDYNRVLILAAPELLSIAMRWAALDAGAWNGVRHAYEKTELLADTRAAIAKATKPLDSVFRDYPPQP